MLNKKILLQINELANAKKLSHLFLLKSNFIHNFNADIISFINAINNNQNTTSIDDLPVNVTLIDGSSQSIKKEQLEEAFYNSNFSTIANIAETGYKILVIKNIENSSINALNAILKSIEDPQNDLIIILTTNAINNVLSTITSRAQVITVEKQTPDQVVESLPLEQRDKSFYHFISWVYPDVNYLENLDYDKYSSLLNHLLVELEKSITKKEEIFVFMNQNLIKDDNIQNSFVLDCFKTILFGSFNQNSDKKLDQKIVELRKRLLNQHPNILNILVDLDNYRKAINAQGIFDLNKQLLLNKLMEYYG
ncbi:hypothetical protein H9M94_03480 [Mycoplasma sp. Pen4]|uniref:hypothetical protein n=1 Tax=Mycoplasma sp. Pen4 TaxID=640330 RepID=UPI00165481AB|nr:hypothetical protein [Mycoplasma sp. Pen4]QNM93629.1 hypothetical protein H9M94_03480 [Mycoplasma sp. Pen4]